MSRRLVERLRGGLGVAVGAFTCTAAGAILLAYFTRWTDEGLLEGAPFIAILAIVLLLGGVALGATWLIRELNGIPKVDGARPEDSSRAPKSTAHAKVLAIAVLVSATAGVTMGQMGELLAGFHRPGEASLNQGAVQGTGNPLDRDDKLNEALLTWSRYARPMLHPIEDGDGSEVPAEEPFEEDPNAPITVLAWFFGIDAGLFTPGYFAVLGLLLVLGTRSLRRDPERFRKSTPQDPEAYVTIARAAAYVLIGAAAADQIENWTGLTSTASTWFAGANNISDMESHSGVATFLGFVTLVKTFSLLFALVCVVLIGLYLLRNRESSTLPWEGVRGAGQSVLAVRIQIVVVGLFTVGMTLRIQAADTFRRWPDDWSVGALASIFVVALAVAVWHSGRWLTTLAIHTSRKQSGRLGVRLALAAAVLALFGFGLGAGWGPNVKAIITVLILAAILAGVSRVAKGVSARDPRQPGMGQAVLPRFLGASVLAVFGLAILKASSGELIYEWIRGHGLRDLIVLVLWGLGFVGLSMLAFVPLPSGTKDRRHSRWVPSLWLLVCVGVWMIVVAILDRQVFSIAPAIGTAGVLAGFLVLLTYTLSSAVATASSAWTSPAPAFSAAGLGRTPVISLVVVWVLALSLLPLDFAHHVTIPEQEGSVAAQGETLQFAFEDWVEDNCLLDEAPAETPGSDSRTMPAVPLILVSSSGGGVRAAVWTSYVMDQAFGYTRSEVACSPPVSAGDPVVNRSRWVFAASGISGGGLGFINYVAQLTEGPSPEPAKTRIQEHLGDDSLASTIAWMLFVESPWALLRFDADRDRSEILQESWERQWPSSAPGIRQNFLDLRIRHDDVPLLILNGASAESGCRFNGSMLDANGRERDDAVTGCLEPQGLEGSPDAVLPATIDLVDFLCVGQEVSMGRAALFTARFPVISPVGEIQQCRVPAEAEGVEERAIDPLPETFVVDGGYLEGSGTATALALWNALTPMVTKHNLNPAATACVVPFFVQIDNSYLEPAGPGDAKAPPNLIGFQELSAVRRNREGFTTSARQAAQIAFGQAFTVGGVRVTRSDGSELDDRYVRFSPVAHPGAVAPLGWTLSKASFSDLFQQYEENDSSIKKLRTWFEGMTCTVTPGGV